MSIQSDYKCLLNGRRRCKKVPTRRKGGFLVIALIVIGTWMAYKMGISREPAILANANSVTTTTHQSTNPPPDTIPKPIIETIAPLPKPKYDFYTELPKRHIRIQEEGSTPHIMSMRQNASIAASLGEIRGTNKKSVTISNASIDSNTESLVRRRSVKIAQTSPAEEANTSINDNNSRPVPTQAHLTTTSTRERRF